MRLCIIGCAEAAPTPTPTEDGDCSGDTTLEQVISFDHLDQVRFPGKSIIVRFCPVYLQFPAELAWLVCPSLSFLLTLWPSAIVFVHIWSFGIQGGTFTKTTSTTVQMETRARGQTQTRKLFIASIPNRSPCKNDSERHSQERRPAMGTCADVQRNRDINTPPP